MQPVNVPVHANLRRGCGVKREACLELAIDSEAIYKFLLRLQSPAQESAPNAGKIWKPFIPGYPVEPSPSTPEPLTFQMQGKKFITINIGISKTSLLTVQQ